MWSLSQLTDLLTSVRGVNKTDAATLVANFGSVGGVVRASLEELQQCPGIGGLKVSACSN